jgi:ABC-type transport system involved in multi-copper enzyme maturation permease subunit
MSTTALSPASRPTVGAAMPRGHVTQMNVVRSEWTKLWTLRSTRWSLLAAVIAQGLLGIGIAAVQMSRWSHLSAHDRATFDSIDVGVGGYHLAQLAIGVLGVMVITGEYSTGMIRSSFMAVPKRLPVLWAKLGVFSAVTFALMLASTAVSFFVVQAIVAQHHVQHAIGDPHALRAVVGTALFLTVLGVLAIGVGALVRNTAGGIALFVFLLFVLPGITALLPHSLNQSISQYLPLNAGFAVATSTFDPGPHLAPWTGFAVFCGYAAIAVGAAVVGLLRRDA